MRASFNNYTLYARFFPAIISALPLFILWFFLAENRQLNELLTFLLSIKFYGGVTISVVALYFYAQIIRIASKYFENKYFIDNLGFPTAYLMTYADSTFSKSYKTKYREPLEWRYVKDDSVSKGNDCGWVDHVEWLWGDWGDWWIEIQ